MSKKKAPATDPRLTKAVALAHTKQQIDEALELMTRPFGEGRDVDYPFEFIDALTEEVFRLLREIGEGK
jgi:hypothetical protein